MKILRFTGYLLLLLPIWHLAIKVFGVPTYVVPLPLEVYTAFVSNAGQIWHHTQITVTEVMLGFIIANVLSAIIAVGIAFFPRIETPAVSAAIVLKTLPIIALAPMLVLWFGPGLWSKVSAVVIVCFFPSLVTILRGIKSLDSSAKDLINLYSPNRLQTIRYFILPGVRSYAYTGLKVSSSLAVVGALVGEFISANSGLGFMIISGYYALNIPLVFAVLIAVSLIGLTMYGLLHILELKYSDNQVTNY